MQMPSSLNPRQVRSETEYFLPFESIRAEGNTGKYMEHNPNKCGDRRSMYESDKNRARTGIARQAVPGFRACRMFHGRLSAKYDGLMYQRRRADSAHSKLIYHPMVVHSDERSRFGVDILYVCRNLIFDGFIVSSSRWMKSRGKLW